MQTIPAPIVPGFSITPDPTVPHGFLVTAQQPPATIASQPFHTPSTLHGVPVRMQFTPVPGWPNQVDVTAAYVRPAGRDPLRGQTTLGQLAAMVRKFFYEAQW